MTAGGVLASQAARPYDQFLVARVGVHDSCHRRHVPGKRLSQEQIPGRPIDVRDRRVPQRVEPIQPVEPGPLLPLPPHELNQRR